MRNHLRGWVLDWDGTSSKVTDILIRKEEDTQIHRDVEDMPCETEAEIRVLCLPAREHQGLLIITRS